MNTTVATDMRAGSVTWCAVVSVLALLMMALGGAVSGNADTHMAYVFLLTTLCASPIALGRIRGENAILTVFLAVYWLFFGARDFLLCWTPSTPTGLPSSNSLLSDAELAILSGGLLTIVGYQCGARLLAQRPDRAQTHSDWPPSALLIVGLTLWLCGLIATYLWQVEILNRAFADAGRRIDSLQGVLVTAGRMVQPLGLLLVVYQFLRGRNLTLGFAIVVMLAAEVTVGFVGDSKESALRGVALLLLATFLVRGRVPRSWLALATVAAVVMVPVFQAYRGEILVGGKDRGRAASDIGKNLERVLDEEIFEYGDLALAESGLLARLSFKPTAELALERIGHTAEYREGETLMLLFPALVPRMLWSEKPDAAVGQLFNRELRISRFRDVYISTTLLVEFYWNFGWIGLWSGMLLLGASLGILNARFDLSRRTSVASLMVICVTVYLFCVRFEDGFAMTTVMWLRSMFGIWLLNLLFSRRAAAVRV
jgi:hypothetical protein